MCNQILDKVKVNQTSITNINVCDGLCYPALAAISPIPHALLQWDFATPLSVGGIVLFSLWMWTGLSNSLTQKWHVFLPKLDQKKPCNIFLGVPVSWNTSHLNASFQGASSWELPYCWKSRPHEEVTCRHSVDTPSWAQPLSHLNLGLRPVSEVLYEGRRKQRWHHHHLMMRIMVRMMRWGRDSNAHHVVFVFSQIS